jgi:hypothetical protein
MPAMDNVEARLAALESRCRRLRLALVGMGLALVLVVMVGAQKPTAPASFTTVNAQRFLVQDAEGRTRAALGMSYDAEAKPVLYVFRADGKAPAFSLTLSGDRPTMVLSGRDGDGSAQAWIDGNGSGAFATFDARDQPVARMPTR